MPNLDERDWAEIYAALDTKVIALKNGTYGPSIDDDCNIEEWIEHLEHIMDEIGGDGENMTEGPEVSSLIEALTECRDVLGEYLQSVESGKDDDAESAYQHADAILKEV